MGHQTHMEERYSGAPSCHGDVEPLSPALCLPQKPLCPLCHGEVSHGASQEAPCPAGTPLGHESEVNGPVCEFPPFNALLL